MFAMRCFFVTIIIIFISLSNYAQENTQTNRIEKQIDKLENKIIATGNTTGLIKKQIQKKLRPR